MFNLSSNIFSPHGTSVDRETIVRRILLIMIAPHWIMLTGQWPIRTPHWSNRPIRVVVVPGQCSMQECRARVEWVVAGVDLVRRHHGAWPQVGVESQVPVEGWRSGEVSGVITEAIIDCSLSVGVIVVSQCSTPVQPGSRGIILWPSPFPLLSLIFTGWNSQNCTIAWKEDNSRKLYFFKGKCQMKI